MAFRRELDRRYALITRRIPTEDVYGSELVYAALSRGDSIPAKCLWVTSPTGKREHGFTETQKDRWQLTSYEAHIGYLIPLLKFADFLRAGVEITVVLLDVYSFLDNVKYPMEQVLQRMHYYRFTIEAALEAIGIPSQSIRFVQESSYQMTRNFINDQWRLLTLVPQQSVKNAWDRSYNPDMLGPMMCPVLQTLAEEHLEADFQFGGADQRGIFEFAERFLPELGYRKRAHLMNPMLPNLMGDKMSSSHPPNTKLMFLDDPPTIAQKLEESYHRHEAVPKNGVLATLRDVLIPFSRLQSERWTDKLFLSTGHEKEIPQREPFWTGTSPTGTVFTIALGEERRHYRAFEEIMVDLSDGKLPESVLLSAISDGINQLLEPVHTAYDGSLAWQTADRLGYPEST